VETPPGKGGREGALRERRMARSEEALAKRGALGPLSGRTRAEIFGGLLRWESRKKKKEKKKGRRKEREGGGGEKEGQPPSPY